MNGKWQLITIVCLAVSITAVISHSLTAWLWIETEPGSYWVVGPGSGQPSVFMAGSSLGSDGISWPRVADQVDLRIEGWRVPGSSPSEWEHSQFLETHVTQTIFVVSPFDLNEYFVSDFHAEVVPLTQVLTDLWKTPMDWPFYKRVVSDYPLMYVRVLFPSAGRSDAVMGGIREKIETNVRSVFHMEKSSTPLYTDPVSRLEFSKVRLTNWSSNQMLRKLVQLHIACQGKHKFNGLKRLAFLRMLRQAQDQGRVLVVVLPVSPAYAKEFLTPDVKKEFEEALADAQDTAPKAHWVRLDRLNDLNSNEYFYDLVHLNTDGQKIATEAFLGLLNHSTGLL